MIQTYRDFGWDVMQLETDPLRATLSCCLERGTMNPARVASGNRVIWVDDGEVRVERVQPGPTVSPPD